MISIKLFLIFILGLFLVDSSFAGFIPAAFEGDFTQVKKTRRGSERKAPVKIQYAYPENIRLDIKEKGIRTLYVCNSKKTWIYSPGLSGEAGEVRVGGSSKYCYSKIFRALNRGLKTNKLYTVKKESSSKYLLEFSKSFAETLGFDKVRIHFSGKKLSFTEVKKLELIVGEKPSVSLVKNSLVIKKKIKPSLFNFKIPKGANVQNMK